MRLKVPAAVTLWAVYYLGPGNTFERFCFLRKGEDMRATPEIVSFFIIGHFAVSFLIIYTIKAVKLANRIRLSLREIMERKR